MDVKRAGRLLSSASLPMSCSRPQVNASSVPNASRSDGCRRDVMMRAHCAVSMECRQSVRRDSEAESLLPRNKLNVVIAIARLRMALNPRKTTASRRDEMRRGRP